MKVFIYNWDSDEKSERLTEVEAALLFQTSYELMRAGQLSKGFIGASTPIYWVRTPIKAN